MDNKNSELTPSKPNLPARKLDSSKTVIAPDIVTFITTDDMAVRQALATAATVRLAELAEDRATTGEIQTWELTITDTLKEVSVTYPGRSAFVINDGSYDVNVWVNNWGMPAHRIKAGETFTMDYEGHNIKYLYFQCDTGESVDIRVVVSG